MLIDNCHKSILIRPATPEDAEKVVSVQVTAWQESYKDIIDQSFLDTMVYSEERVSRRQGYFQSNKSLKCFVALCGNQIIGFIDVGLSREHPLGKGEIYALYVLNDHKRQGIGTALWAAAVEYLNHQNLFPYIVWGLKENKSARKFYEKLGGVLIGTKESDMGGKLYPEVCYVFDRAHRTEGNDND